MGIHCLYSFNTEFEVLATAERQGKEWGTKSQDRHCLIPV